MEGLPMELLYANDLFSDCGNKEKVRKWKKGMEKKGKSKCWEDKNHVV